MATIINQLELLSNCENAQEIKSRLVDYVNNHLGHAVEDITEAREFYSDLYDEESLEMIKYGDSQSAEFELDNESARVSVRITEIYVESGSMDYCYEIYVEEV